MRRSFRKVTYDPSILEKGVGWPMQLCLINPGNPLVSLAKVEENHWNDETQIQLRVKDLR